MASLLSANSASGIYIHIPFCIKRCNYCDFYLVTNTDLIDKFLCCLKKEISISKELYRHQKFDTIFFGGGTPSLLSCAQIESLIEHLYKTYDVDINAEISLEANPENFYEKNFTEFKSAGINRLSLGVQSFIDDELKFLTRQHSAAQAEDVVKNSVEIFGNVNIDIIYSLPSQDKRDLKISLDKTAELNVSHVSAYTLTYEPRTVLHKSLEKNLIEKNSEFREAELYEFVSQIIVSSGFNHYEVSNFSKAGYECRHNLHYWNYDNYAGFGPSAHSLMSGKRWNNFRDISKYISCLEKNLFPSENKYELSSEQAKLEFTMLALRSGGINFSKYRKIFKKDFETEYFDALRLLVEKEFGLIEKNNFRLTEKGYSMTDEIIAKYF